MLNRSVSAATCHSRSGCMSVTSEAISGYIKKRTCLCTHRRWLTHENLISGKQCLFILTVPLTELGLLTGLIIMHAYHSTILHNQTQFDWHFGMESVSTLDTGKCLQFKKLPIPNFKHENSCVFRQLVGVFPSWQWGACLPCWIGAITICFCLTRFFFF